MANGKGKSAEGIVHLGLNAFGPCTVEQLHLHLASSSDPNDRISRVACARALRLLVASRQAYAVIENGVTTYRLKSWRQNAKR